jgi:hypothetical protein
MISLLIESLLPSTISFGELIIFVILVVIGIVIILVLSAVIHFILPIIAAVVIYLFTGNLLFAGIAFLAVAILQLLARR